jgi:hypothetical protein
MLGEFDGARVDLPRSLQLSSQDRGGVIKAYSSRASFSSIASAMVFSTH